MPFTVMKILTVETNLIVRSPLNRSPGLEFFLGKLESGCVDTYCDKFVNENLNEKKPRCSSQIPRRRYAM
jgi:hypothetical protein